ncbi:MAG: type II secretion system protein M [Proteobacteria bacterium]|nr:type II secretion system protein M [Pseudomonadota bacterium]
MIKQYWEKFSFKDLSQKEKIQLLVGGVTIAFLFLFLAVWLPLHYIKSDLESEVKSQRELIMWMQQNAPLLKSAGQPVNDTKSAQDIFSSIEATFKSQPELFNNIVITRNSETKATISFNNVPFDDLLKQLIQMKKQLKVEIDEIQVNKLEKSGLVEGRVVLLSSH